MLNTQIDGQGTERQQRPWYARLVGGLLLAIPFLIATALRFFPQYDARPGQFRSWYPNIVSAGDEYLLSLVLFLLVAAVLTALAAALLRRPPGSGIAVTGPAAAALFVSATGFAVAAVAGAPVWFWAREAASGRNTMLDSAVRSESWASFSQTMILLIGLGGLLVGMAFLAVAAAREAWMPRLVFWGTVAVSGAVFAAGIVMTFFWLSLGGPPMLWTLSLGVTLLVRGRFA